MKTRNAILAAVISLACTQSLTLWADGTVQPTLKDDLNSVAQTAKQAGQQVKSDAAETGQKIKTNVKNKVQTKKQQIQQKMSQGPTLQERAQSAKDAANAKISEGGKKTADTVNQGLNNASGKLDNTLKGLGGN